MSIKTLSIITVVFNDAINLENTIKSLLLQDLSKCEFIVIDGGSSDDTIKVIEKYSYLFDVFISEQDEGIYDAMNKGIKLATSDWITFLNAGDIYTSSNLLKIVTDEMGSLVDKNLIVIDFIKNGITHSPVLNIKFLISNMICHQSLFYHKSLFSRYKYDLRYKISADYLHLLNVWSQVKIKYLNQVSVLYLGGGFSESQNLVYLHRIERINAITQSNLYWPLNKLIVLILKAKLFLSSKC